jgi:hypothetical protein
VGISVYNFNLSGSSLDSQTVHVTDNTVTVGKNAWAGIWANGLSQATAVLDISGNTVNGTLDVATGAYPVFGIYLTSLSNGVNASVSGNFIGSLGGPLTAGIVVWSANTTNPVSISDGTIKGATVGIDLDDADVNFGGASGTTILNVSDVDISGGAVGVRVGAVPSNATGAPFYVYAGPNTVEGSVVMNLSGGSIIGATTGIQVQAGSYTASLDALGGTTISGGTTGVLVEGANASAAITGNHIYANTTGILLSGGWAAINSNNFDDGGLSADNTTDIQRLRGR